MQLKSNTTCKITFPPRFTGTEEFDPVALSEIVTDKLYEIYSNQTDREKAAKWLEKTCYVLLQKVEKYSISWFKLMLYLYNLEFERDQEKRWIRYWQKVGDLYQEVKDEGKFDLEKLRSIPIIDLIDAPFRQSGSRITTPCPIHHKDTEKEKSKSFFIYSDNSFHCFSCGSHGAGAIDFVMQRDNVDFVKAVQTLN